MSEQPKPFRFAVSVSQEDVPSQEELMLRVELLHYKARDLGLLPSGTKGPFSGRAFMIEVGSSSEERKALGDFISLIVKYKGFLEEEVVFII